MQKNNLTTMELINLLSPDAHHIYMMCIRRQLQAQYGMAN